jgi:hypothetical protein
MILVDLRCGECGFTSEELVDDPADMPVCPKCQIPLEHAWSSAPKLLAQIVPDYPGAKARKAGYQHTTYAAQPATKIQSGYGGCQGPKN